MSTTAAAMTGATAATHAFGVVAQESRRRLRLTRRGRIVLIRIPIGVLLVAVLVAAGATLAHAGASPVARSVVVQPGDSLWAIAWRVAPQRDPRDEIADIVRLNALRSDLVLVGQRLVVP